MRCSSRTSLPCLIAGVLLASVVVANPASASHYTFPGDAPYSVAKEKLDAALACHGGSIDGSGQYQPVLLVHGTGVNRRLNWEWNYWPQLPKLGFDVCWIQLPNEALGDIQVSAEYVARAVQRMHKWSGEEIDILGHSQGGLVPRWAIKWFPAGRRVRDYIGLASPNHGTVVAETACLVGCFEAALQMGPDSKFVAALNADNEIPSKIHYTNVYTTFDELVQPVGTSALEDGTNILLQDLCPGRPVDHAGIAGDAVTYRLVIDALTNKGPASVNRLPADVCSETTMPGWSPPPYDAWPGYDGGTETRREPPLKSYARDYAE